MTGQDSQARATTAARVVLVINLVAAAVLAVVTVLGIVTGRGLSPVLTGCMAVSAAFAAFRLVVRGGRR